MCIAASARPNRRRRLAFSLHTLVAVLATSACGFTWDHLQIAERERLAQAIISRSGSIQVDGKPLPSDPMPFGRYRIGVRAVDRIQLHRGFGEEEREAD